MSTPLPSPIPPAGARISVSGGDGGLSANTDAILALGVRFVAAAEACRQRAVALRSLAGSPFGLLGALAAAGPGVAGGVSVAGASERIVRAAGDLAVLAFALDDLGGKLVATALDYAGLDRHLFGPSVLARIDDLAKTVAGDGVTFWATLAATHQVGRAAQAALTTDPAQLDPFARMLTADIGLFGLLADDGHGVVRNAGTDRLDVAATPPRRLTDVLADLARRNDDGHSGEVDVRILSMPDGSRRAIVDITGTKSWDPLPTRDVTSLSTNARAVLGLPTAYEQGVLAAMRRAGVRRTDDVLMVGHSEGGMVAVNAARHADRTGEFTVTHVVTIGSPIGRIVGAMPRRTAVLALENSLDVIPHVDGRANPDRQNVTTVSGTAGDGTVSGDHDITDGYEPIAAAAQCSHERSVRNFLGSADGYFRAESVVTHTYQIERY